MASADRRREVERLLDRVSAWANSRDDISALALVGSWARDDAREDSDVDLVLLTDEPDAFIEGVDWIEVIAPGARLIGTGDWGAITERRLRLPSGLEVEIGIGLPSWAATDPVDPGTHRVVQAGFRPLYDASGLLARL